MILTSPRTIAFLNSTTLLNLPCLTLKQMASRSARYLSNANQPLKAEYMPEKKTLKFDTTIHLGHVLTVATFIVGGLMLYSEVKVDLATLSLQIATVSQDIREADDKFDLMSSKITELENRVLSLELSK